MSIKYLLTTTTADNKIVVADQIPANSIGSGQVDSSIALQSSLDAAIKGMSPKGSVRTILDLPQLSNTSPTPSFTPGPGTLTATTNFTLTGVSISGVTDLVAGDKVLITFSTADKQYAGIYDITDAGADDPGGSPIIFTRASNFNESAEVALNSYVTVSEGDFADEIWYLTNTAPVTINTTPLTFDLWGGTGSTYTAGNGISISGGNEISAKLKSAGGLEFSGTGSDEISVKVAASNALLKDGTSGELSVRTASASVSGVITSTQFKDLTRTVAASSETSTPVSTTGNGTTTVGLPATPVSTIVMVEATVHSKDAGSGLHCVTQVRFALRRGAAGHSVLIGNSITTFQEGDSSITSLTVEGQAGSGGADAILITGATGHDLAHNAVITVQYVPNSASI